MIHYVYKIINITNNLYYIGSRTHPNPEKDEYMGSSKILKNLYKLKGIENFKKEILKKCSTRSEANIIEDKLIEEALKKEPKNIYNIRRSGYFNKNSDIYNKRNDLWNDYYNNIRNEYINGIKIISLSKKYKCDIGTIHSIVSDLKIDNKWSNAWKSQIKIIEEYQDGFSRKYLSKKYKCDINTISSVLIKNNIQIRSVREQFKLNKQKNILQGKKREVDIEKVKELYIVQDLSLEEVAKKLHIGRDALKKRIIENNIPVKSYKWSTKQHRHPAWKKLEEIKKDKDILNKSQLCKKYKIKDFKTLKLIVEKILSEHKKINI